MPQYKYARLNKNEEQKLLFDFFRSLATLRGFKEMAGMFGDLLTKAELTMLAKRLQVARLLLQGVKYRDIAQQLKVSAQTIARINLWLEEAGDGFRLVFSRYKTKPVRIESSMADLWSNLKRQAPLYFWPEIVIDSIIKLANQKQKNQLYKVLKNLQRKQKLNRDLEKLMTRLH